MSEKKSWDGIRAQLEARLAELNEEIGNYPGPITGCDAQFNHLLDERGRLNAELSRLNGAMAAPDSEKELNKFKESCPFLAG